MSDEAYFTVDGAVNRHNCVIWAYENHHVVLTKSLISPKVCVWMAFSAKNKLQPFFFDTTIDQFNYCDLMQNHMMPQLRAKRIKSTTIFQHDGDPPHFSLRAREFLSKQFPANRVISPRVWTPLASALSGSLPT